MFTFFEFFISYDSSVRQVSVYFIFFLYGSRVNSRYILCIALFNSIRSVVNKIMLFEATSTNKKIFTILECTVETSKQFSCIFRLKLHQRIKRFSRFTNAQLKHRNKQFSYISLSKNNKKFVVSSFARFKECRC